MGLGYTHLYGPDIKRTSSAYRDALLPEVLPASLVRINSGLPSPAIDEAVRKLTNIEGVDLVARNETFTDYLQSGVEVTFFDGDRTRSDVVRIVDYERPDNNSFHDQDIVYVLTSETIDDLGHSFLFNNPKGLPAVAGTETTIMHITRRDLVIPAYINYLLQTEYFKKLLRQYVKGMKVFRVHPDDIAHIVVDLPTLGEQAKMVSLLDVLFEQQLILSRTNGYLAA